MPDQERPTFAEDMPTQGLRAISVLREIEEAGTASSYPEAPRTVVHLAPNLTPVVTLDPSAVLADWLGEVLGTGESVRIELEEPVSPKPNEGDFILEAADHTARLARVLAVDEQADDRIERWLRARDRRPTSTTRLSRRR